MYTLQVLNIEETLIRYHQLIRDFASVHGTTAIKVEIDGLFATIAKLRTRPLAVDDLTRFSDRLDDVNRIFLKALRAVERDIRLFYSEMQSNISTIQEKLKLFTIFSGTVGCKRDFSSHSPRRRSVCGHTSSTVERIQRIVSV